MSTEVGSIRAPAAERAQAAWEMRIAGGSWATIARELGYANPENAMRATRTYCGSVPKLTRDDLRETWRARLEKLWLIALSDAHEHRPGAVTAGVRVVSAAAALDGLNEAQKVDLEVTRVWDGLLGELNDAGYLGS